jgi:guanylate kinase
VPESNSVSHSRSPLLVVLSGPSGVGKDTVMERLHDVLPDLHYAVTATTRAPRPGETEGKSYYFLTKDQYDAMLDRGELLAPARVHGNWYGAPLQPVRAAFSQGKDVLLKIDVQGAIAVRRRIPQAVFLFLAPPSPEHLVERLGSRRTESRQELARRVRHAAYEMAQMPHYDYCVVNHDDDLEQTVANVACVISAERLRINRQPIDLGSE